MNRVRSLTAVGAAALLFAGCQDATSTAPARTLRPQGPALSVSAEPTAYSPQLDQLRQALLAKGVKNFELGAAEISVAADSAGWQGATTLLANDRTHTLSAAFVPNDPRRGGSSDISYIIDERNLSAVSRPRVGANFTLGQAQLEPEIDAAMLRWQNQPSCGAPHITKVAFTGADPDLFDGVVFEDPSLIGTPLADITQAGWLPRAFFDALLPPGSSPPGSSFILGVTLTAWFVDDDGNPTDIDHDGRLDVAFREIYYNKRFPWTVDAANPRSIDIQSVATHESGHAYGLGHFGYVFLDTRGFIHFAPRAVMNAGYASAFRDLTGTDNASFCQLWANAK